MSFKEKLIELVRAKPILYDLKNLNYRRSDIKEKIWREIAAKLKSSAISEQVCKSKWKSLRDTYRRIRRQTPTSGSAPNEPIDEKHTNKWKYFQQMNFLYSIDDQRNTIGNFEKVNESNSESYDLYNDSSVDLTDFDNNDPDVGLGEIICSTPAKKRKITASSSKSDVHKNFQDFLDVAVKTVSQLDEPTKPISSTSLLFSSLAMKIEKAHLPTVVLDGLEMEISNIVYKRLHEHYNDIHSESSIST